jgi:predicted phage tail protein
MTEFYYTVNDHVVTVKEWAGWAAEAIKELTAENAALRAEVADAWDRGYTSGHSRAMRRMSDEPNVEPGSNPYRAALPEGEK